MKGGGAALTREKIIDYTAEKYVIIVDESKVVKKLGERSPIPVEVIPVAWKSVAKKLEEEYGFKVGLRTALKGKNGPIVTDNGNFILDVKLTKEIKPEEFEIKVKSIPGVVETGVFALKRPWKIIVATSKEINII